MKHWELDVERPKPGWIGKGSYARLCSVILDPLLPSSSESPFGSMRYYFEARLKGAKGFGITRSDWVVAQEVWILNSSLPFYNNISIDNPTAVHGIWRDALKYSISIPSDLLYLGQRVAVTVQLHPFNQGSVYEGDEVQVIYATFTLRELKTFRAQFVRDVHQTTEKVLNITVNTAWRQSVDGWRKTINLSLPSSPIMSPNMQTKFMDVAHTLAVMIEFRTVKISKIEKLKAQLDVQITAPCFAPTLPPDYGETTRHVESLLLLEPPAIDPNESLPGYSRYE
ncbi:hypothetical protein BCR41DRAFT_86916 [Lobosporangium transversale]|uniref:Arrestin C-terminal-like domain-containing protein n=1 Tax=Lobosporangium transversale TaxID=64571 RepID=A0A1Y2GLF8_9FUNG|nr:hypothetical protein BCR41DRAFT_86916 [Lobosporangium transversale]ORZ14409.1 hypothetical protein BCR41DRAFT_86916 [Lobosporangium transversale]|eukprot:XP_021880887.1 hypothetical protein BCR41DRAFT_86916 [Lobosporangium transversale]